MMMGFAMNAATKPKNFRASLARLLRTLRPERRLIGLGMHTPAGRVIENACPIQDRFPGYAELPPVPFDLESFEEVERACLVQAAGRRYGRPERWEFETTIAAAIADLPATRSPWPT